MPNPTGGFTKEAAMAIADTQGDNLKYEMEEEAGAGARIKVIGVGGAGCNAVSRLVVAGLGGVEFYAMDTDHQALSACQAPRKLQLGAKITRGLGTGSNWEIGRQAALENTDAIVELLQGADMVFVSAGLGGGTGTGAAPVIASRTCASARPSSGFSSQPAAAAAANGDASSSAKAAANAGRFESGPFTRARAGECGSVLTISRRYSSV